ncbi:MAG: DUF4197 domain-containing protein [Chitinophagaceae bacterium]
MKKIIYSIAFSVIVLHSNAQLPKINIPTIKNPLQKTENKDTLSNNTVISGLKEALQVGIQKGTQQLSAVDGFFGNAALKILMPPEAVKVEQSLRKLGMNKQVDDAILNMNRAAEEATKQAAPIFINAIKGMSFTDAFAILRGGDNAATNFLQSKTTASLTTAFKPVIETALNKIDATKHWNTIFSNYNRFSLQKVNPDLTAYVTEKALQGIFMQLAIEEGKIRKDPMARTTDILKTVFGR